MHPLILIDSGALLPNLRLLPSRALLDISDISMSNLKQETITEGEIFLKMVPFPKQRFVKMTDNDLGLRSGYINNNIISKALGVTFGTLSSFLFDKSQIAPPYFNMALCKLCSKLLKQKLSLQY